MNVITQGLKAADQETDSNENSQSQLKTEKEPGEINGEIDEEKSDDEKSSSDNDSDLNDKDSNNNLTGDKDTLALGMKQNSVIQPPVLTKNSGSIAVPGGKSSGPTSPNSNTLNNTGNLAGHI